MFDLGSCRVVGIARHKRMPDGRVMTAMDMAIATWGGAVGGMPLHL